MNRAEEQIVLGLGNQLQFHVATDGAFGGKSKAEFHDNRYFRGELVGETPFAAIRTILPDHVQDVGDFSGLALRVKSADQRNYAINLQAPSFFAHDLHQGFIVLPRANEFFDLKIPFDKLLLTGKGRVREVQRHLDTPRIVTLGLSVGGPGAVAGPFELEIDWIKWIRDA